MRPRQVFLCREVIATAAFSALSLDCACGIIDMQCGGKGGGCWCKVRHRFRPRSYLGNSKWMAMWWWGGKGLVHRGGPLCFYWVLSFPEVGVPRALQRTVGAAGARSAGEGVPSSDWS